MLRDVWQILTPFRKKVSNSQNRKKKIQRPGMSPAADALQQRSWPSLHERRQRRDYSVNKRVRKGAAGGAGAFFDAGEQPPHDQ